MKIIDTTHLAKIAKPFAFTRHFTAGILAGLTHEDTITFPERADFLGWAKSINAKNKAGKLEYRVTF